jgi:glutathione S-transferase
MILLYELAWSHYCEKVRLALDYMQLPWRAVSIDAFEKQPLRGRPRPTQLPSRTVPAILDEATNAYVMDSTPILRYLAERYPEAPQLFPGDAAQRAAVDAQLLAIRQARTQRPPVRRKLRQRDTVVPFSPRDGSAANDQQRLWNRQTLTMPLHYALTLRRNKLRQQAATDQIR